MIPPTTDARVAFLFTKGRRVRLESAQETPSELFYSYVELKRWGWNVDLLEEVDLSTAHKTLPGRALARVLPWPLNMNLTRVGALALTSTVRRLNRYAAIVATNQQLGTELSVLASVGLLKRPLFIIVMGLLPLEPAGSRLALALRAVLRRTTVMSISRGEEASMRQRLGPAIDIRYMPFGVDHRFWRPNAAASGGYVLSVGNDPNRDFPLLVRVWRPTWPRLRIITRLPIRAHASNVEIVHGHYSDYVITDAEMRQHVQGALFSVIPLRDTLQPSGQSAALQAMACGIPLILSDTQGLWDRAVMRDDETCLLPPAGSAEALLAAIQRLWNSEPLRHRLGAAGRTAIEQHFTADHMAAALARQLLEKCR